MPSRLPSPPLQNKKDNGGINNFQDAPYTDKQPRKKHPILAQTR